MSSLPPDIAASLQKELRIATVDGARRVGGGSIHHALRVDSSSGAMFVKFGPRSTFAQFEAECEGLREISRTNAIRTPAVLATGVTPSHAYAAFEWIEFRPSTAESDAQLGKALAQLHSVTAERFGWHRDNFIGATPQRNAWSDDWIDFFRRLRLCDQLERARANGARSKLLRQGERLIEVLPAFFSGYQPVPALIHGDLWGGNHAVDPHGEPVIFDPAVYYADREAELAMTYLFGGFSQAFYRSYESVWPPAPGANVRRGLYQLYHVLNHFNLFGGGYQLQAEAMIERLLAEARG
jgi:fructosamine-3-kinase